MNCPASWSHMRGDDRVRHCTHCDHKVYNLSEMNREEALALLQQSEERVCARYYRRADGTIMTRDCGRKVQARARAATRMSALLVAVLGAVGLGSVIVPRLSSSVVMGVMAMPEATMGKMAVAAPTPLELRQRINDLNDKIQAEKDLPTRRQYADERQALIERLRGGQGGGEVRS